MNLYKVLNGTENNLKRNNYDTKRKGGRANEYVFRKYKC